MVITHKRSNVPGLVPSFDELTLGEISVNTADGILYIKKSDGITDEIVPIGPSELERIDVDGTNYGWRLFGMDSSNYGSIGSMAVDLSFSDGTQPSGATNNGAIGDYSFTVGKNNVSGGLVSFAGGELSLATGSHSFAYGYKIINDKDKKIVFGGLNENKADTVFEIGAGYEDNNGEVRRNIFEINESGIAVTPMADVALIEGGPDETLVTKLWTQLWIQDLFFVDSPWPEYLNDLQDVNLQEPENSPAAGDILVFDGNMWVATDTIDGGTF